MRLAALALSLAPTAAHAAESPRLAHAFRHGELLVYETSTTADGQVRITAGDSQQERAVRASVTSKVLHEVAAIEDDGSALVRVSLSYLALRSPAVDQGLVLELVETGIEIHWGAACWRVSVGEESRLPAALRAGFGDVAPAELFWPTAYRVLPTGEVLEQRSPAWYELVGEMPLLASVAALCEPFGSPWLELPAGEGGAGQPWVQEREALVPGSDLAAYPLLLHYHLGPTEGLPAGERRISFDGGGSVADQPLALALPADRAAMAVLESLDHRCRGQVAFDSVQGRVTHQHLTSQVTLASVQRLQGQTIHSETVMRLESSRRLVQVRPGVPAKS